MFNLWFLYRPIWKNAWTKTKSISNRSPNSIAENQRRLQLRLAMIMSITVLEFNIFQIPFSALTLIVAYQIFQGELTVPHEFATVAFCLLWIDSIINPLWTSLISKSNKLLHSMDSKRTLTANSAKLLESN